MGKSIKNRLALFIFVFQMFFFYISVEYLLNPAQLNIFALQYGVLLLLFSILSYKKGFVLIAAYILASGIGYLIYIWVQTGNVDLQMETVWIHIVNMINWALMYASIFTIKGIKEENALLKLKVEELSKYIGETKLLSRQEFEERSQMLVKAMERRKEKGYLIFCDVTHMTQSVRNAAFGRLAEVALIVFRNEYDLIGKWEDDVLVILLQNTDEEGKTIAINRYFNKIKETLNVTEEELSFRSELIGDTHEGKVTQ